MGDLKGPVILAAAGAEAHGGMPPLFALLAVMLVGVVLASLLLLRLQQSLLIGYFLSGVAIANSGVLGLLGGESMQGGISQMSEFGVMLLMFTLGLEFSLSDLKYLRRLALGGGVLQMTLCALPVFGVALWGAGISWQGAVILAVALAMSSTAVSVKSFQDMDLAGSPPARLALGVAIFQDLFIIGFLLLLPMLIASTGSEGIVGQVLLLSGRGLLFVLLAWVLAKWVIPRLLYAVARTRNRELFTLTVVGLCIGVAFAGGLLQLSLALGAFVAGLAVSESIYKHRILADVLPMKDLFLTLFFVSVGLMIDLKVALPLWKSILWLTLGIMIMKTVVITVVARWLGLVPKVAVVGGVSLASAGEFSLLLLQKVGGEGFWTAEWQQIMLASAALSMGLLPAAMRASVPLGEKLEAWGWKPRTTPLPDAATLRRKVSALNRHAIICGFGPVGQHLNESLKDQGVQTLVIDLNADTVRKLQKAGQPVLFADAAHSETWELAQLPKAQLVAFTFPDASVTATALEMVREHSPEVTVLARARFASDRKRLKLLGADAVVHDEEQTSKAAVSAAAKLCQLHLQEDASA